MHIEDLWESKKEQGRSFDWFWWFYLVGAPISLLSSFFSPYLHIPIAFDLINDGDWMGIDGQVNPVSISTNYGYIHVVKETVSNLQYWSLFEEFVFIIAFGLIIFAMREISNSLLNKQLFNKTNLNWLRLIAIVFLYLFALHPFLESFIADKAVENLTHEAISTTHLINRNYAYILCSSFFFTLVLIFKEGKTLKEDTDLTI